MLEILCESVVFVWLYFLHFFLPKKEKLLLFALWWIDLVENLRMHRSRRFCFWEIRVLAFHVAKLWLYWRKEIILLSTLLCLYCMDSAKNLRVFDFKDFNLKNILIMWLLRNCGYVAPAYYQNLVQTIIAQENILSHGLDSSGQCKHQVLLFHKIFVPVLFMCGYEMLILWAYFWRIERDLSLINPYPYPWFRLGS